MTTGHNDRRRLLAFGTYGPFAGSIVTAKCHVVQADRPPPLVIPGAARGARFSALHAALFLAFLPHSPFDGLPRCDLRPCDLRPCDLRAWCARGSPATVGNVDNVPKVTVRS